MRWLAIFLAVILVTGLTALPGTDAQDKTGAKRGLTFEVYRDAKKEFRWRLKAANGQTIGTSGQGYRDKGDCRHAIDLIQKGAADAKVEEASEK